MTFISHFWFILVDSPRRLFWASDGFVKRDAEYIVLQFDRPGVGLTPLAMLLLDLASNLLFIRAHAEVESVTGCEDAEVVKAFLTQLAEDALQGGGREIIERLEDTLSNALRLTERKTATIDNITTALDDLFREQVAGTKGPDGT
jgi:hypothetical protein